jgi:hypothetical protein
MEQVKVNGFMIAARNASIFNPTDFYDFHAAARSS